MQRKIMIDIETTGLEKSHGFILEVAAVILAKNHDDSQFYIQSQYQALLPYDGSPATEFARKYQKDLYKECNQLYKTYKEKTGDPIHHGLTLTRKNILQFFKSNGFKKSDDIRFIGRNVQGFDLDWLYHHGVINKNEHHYHVYDLTSHEDFISDVLGITPKELRSKALLVADGPSLPQGSQHRALFDCVSQTREYNGLINLISKKGW